MLIEAPGKRRGQGWRWGSAEGPLPAELLKGSTFALPSVHDKGIPARLPAQRLAPHRSPPNLSSALPRPTPVQPHAHRPPHPHAPPPRLPPTHLYRPMKTGMVTRVGRQPASGLTPAVWYSLAVSTWCASKASKAGHAGQHRYHFAKPVTAQWSARQPPRCIVGGHLSHPQPVTDTKALTPRTASRCAAINATATARPLCKPHPARCTPAAPPQVPTRVPTTQAPPGQTTGPPTCSRSASPAYLACSSFTRGCSACSARVDSTCREGV